MNILRNTHADARQLEQLRAEHALKRAEIEHLERAPLPDAELRAAVAATIAAQVGALRQRAPLGGLRSPGGTAVLSLNFAPDRDVLPSALLVALLQGPQLVDTLVAEAKAANPMASGPPAAERAKRLAKARDELAALEEREEREVLRLEAAGYTVIRRADADPRLLLRLWSEPASKK